MSTMGEPTGHYELLLAKQRMLSRAMRRVSETQRRRNLGLPDLPPLGAEQRVIIPPPPKPKRQLSPREVDGWTRRLPNPNRRQRQPAPVLPWHQRIAELLARITMEEFGLHPCEIENRFPKSEPAKRAQQCCFALCLHYTGLPSRQVGALYGRSDTPILKGQKLHPARVSSDNLYAERVRHIKARVEREK